MDIVAYYYNNMAADTILFTPNKVKFTPTITVGVSMVVRAHAPMHAPMQLHAYIATRMEIQPFCFDTRPL